MLTPDTDAYPVLDLVDGGPAQWVGRNHGLPDGKRMSRQHCQFWSADGTIFMQDGSACGTWLNGSRVEKAQPVTLHPGDVVSFPTAGVDVPPSYKCSAAKRAARGKAKAKETSAVAAPKRQRASPKTKAAAPAPALDRRQLAALAAERRAEAEAGRRAEAAAEAKAKAEVETEAKAKARGEAEVKAAAARLAAATKAKAEAKAKGEAEEATLAERLAARRAAEEAATRATAEAAAEEETAADSAGGASGGSAGGDGRSSGLGGDRRLRCNRWAVLDDCLDDAPVDRRPVVCIQADGPVGGAGSRRAGVGAVRPREEVVRHEEHREASKEVQDWLRRRRCRGRAHVAAVQRVATRQHSLTSGTASLQGQAGERPRRPDVGGGRARVRQGVGRRRRARAAALAHLLPVVSRTIEAAC